MTTINVDAVRQAQAVAVALHLYRQTLTSENRRLEAERARQARLDDLIQIGRRQFGKLFDEIGMRATFSDDGEYLWFTWEGWSWELHRAGSDWRLVRLELCPRDDFQHKDFDALTRAPAALLLLALYDLQNRPEWVEPDDFDDNW